MTLKSTRIVSEARKGTTSPIHLFDLTEVLIANALD
jgi:hypothetical protein